MKKTMIFALVATLMFAFASCGGGTKESKQFTEQKEKIQEIEQMIESAETCDDLTMAAFGFLALAIEDEEYLEEEKMTAAEEDEFEKLAEELSNKMSVKAAALGCDKEEEVDNEGFEFEFENDEPIE